MVAFALNWNKSYVLNILLRWSSEYFQLAMLTLKFIMLCFNLSVYSDIFATNIKIWNVSSVHQCISDHCLSFNCWSLYCQFPRDGTWWFPSPVVHDHSSAIIHINSVMALSASHSLVKCLLMAMDVSRRERERRLGVKTAAQANVSWIATLKDCFRSMNWKLIFLHKN